VQDGIQLSITRQEVQDLPPVNVGQLSGQDPGKTA
jgi:hypothetical protein